MYIHTEVGWGGVRPSSKTGCSGYNSKLHMMMRLKFWRVWSTPSLPLLPGLLSSIVIVLIRVPAMSRIDLFENYSYSIEHLILYNYKLFILRIVV